MQMLSPHLVPVSILLLLSIASCSSRTETNQVNPDQNNPDQGISGESILEQPSPELTGDSSAFPNIETIVVNNATSSSSTDGDLVPNDGVIQSNSFTSVGSFSDAGLSLNSDNYEQIAENVLQAIRMTDLERERVNARALLFELNESGWGVVAGESELPGLTLASQEMVMGEFGGAGYAQTFICDEGGSLSIELKDFNGGPFYLNRASFDNCHLNEQIHNGSLESSGARRAPDLTLFTNYTRSSAEQSITITGEHMHNFPLFGIPESTVWTDTGFVITNSAGTLKVDTINWFEECVDAPNLDSNQGFVQLADGTVQYVAQYNYAANLQTTFNYTPAQSLTGALSVDVNLVYQTSYFEWEGHSLSGFDLPTFPVSDLGTTIDVHSEFDIFTGTSQSFDSLPKDPAPIWHGGQIRITAPDSTSLVIQPNSSPAEPVLIELNGSGEQESKLWEGGIQVDCLIAVL